MDLKLVGSGEEEVSNVVVNEVDFNPEFISRMIPKVGRSEGLPAEVIPDYENDEEFLKKVHHVLLEVQVEEGSLVCPETGRKFPIKNGIPNMLLNEDEV
ncbi:Multifunctional methyltransferase subunit TRM112-like protein [Acropora cervicornis]|uniref:Multifunctional methyltransferase subunit TRM112-like protein n=1 Tax=Acropora cervicornis TaxID=6130 RepID=A0AAD9UW28_ACRCE|nr:Multifunctional methyltransferase subunit TRM112-like protein [Acropora cervicornis]